MARESKALTTIITLNGEEKERVIARIALSLHVSERKAREYVKLLVTDGQANEDELYGTTYLWSARGWQVEVARREAEGLRIKQTEMEKEAEAARVNTIEAYLTEST